MCLTKQSFKLKHTFQKTTVKTIYQPGKRIRRRKTNQNVQDAHEAIRPTYIDRDPESVKEYLSRDEYRLYKLIWSRFLASQWLLQSLK